MYDDMEADDMAALSEAEVVPPPRPVLGAQVEPSKEAKAGSNELRPEDDGRPDPPRAPLSLAEHDQLEALLARKRGSRGQGWCRNLRGGPGESPAGTDGKDCTSKEEGEPSAFGNGSQEGQESDSER